MNEIIPSVTLQAHWIHSSLPVGQITYSFKPWSMKTYWTQTIKYCVSVKNVNEILFKDRFATNVKSTGLVSKLRNIKCCKKLHPLKTDYTILNNPKIPYGIPYNTLWNTLWYTVEYPIIHYGIPYNTQRNLLFCIKCTCFICYIVCFMASYRVCKLILDKSTDPTQYQVTHPVSYCM